MAQDIPQYEYQFEIETILHQFIALIDGAIVMRYDRNHQTGERTLVNEIKPHYVFGPKARILYQLVSKAKNYVLPLFAISIKGIKVDKERFADKYGKIQRMDENNGESYRRPVPITIDLQVSIMAKYMTDLYQLYGKLATQFQPYCVYSWAVPSNENFKYEELRNKIEWDLNISMDSRDKLTEQDEDKFVGSMNFSVQGWLFPESRGCDSSIILNIGTSLFPDISAYDRTLKADLTRVYENSCQKPKLNRRDLATTRPLVLNRFIAKKLGSNVYYFIVDKFQENITIKKASQKITISGYNLDDVKVLLLTKKKKSTEGEYATMNYGTDYITPYWKWNTEEKKYEKTEKEKKISGYVLGVEEQGQNRLTIDFSTTSLVGQYDIVVCNSVDYQSIGTITLE